MAALYAIVYPDHQTAEQVLETAKGLESAGYLKILEQALVRKSADGEVSIDNEKHPVRRGAVAGGVLGGIAGLIFLAPVAGVAIGAGLGAAVGKGDKSGGSGDFKSFRDTVSGDLPNGGAAVVIFGETEARDRVVQTLGHYGGTIHSMDISAGDLARLQKQVDKIAGS
jgi:uncharacterized membrane protein